MDLDRQRRGLDILRASPDGLTLEEIAEQIGSSSAGARPALDESGRAGVLRESRRRIDGRRTHCVSVRRIRT